MPKNMKSTGLVRYVGEGAFFRGLPARDMTLEEWETYPVELCAQALGAELYELPADEKPADEEVNDG